MDAFTWFKSVFRGVEAVHQAPLRADLATERWADVPLIPVAGRSQPPAPPADDDDWGVAIAHAKMRAAFPKAPSLMPPPLPHHAPARAASPPPPPPPRRASMRSIAMPKPPRSADPGAMQARLDALVWGGLRKPAAPRPALAARRPAPEDQATPLPLSPRRSLRRRAP